MKIKPMHLGKTLESPWIFFLPSSLSLFLSIKNLEFLSLSPSLAEQDTQNGKGMVFKTLDIILLAKIN